MTDVPERLGMNTYLPERTTDFGVPENVMLALEQLSISITVLMFQVLLASGTRNLSCHPVIGKKNSSSQLCKAYSCGDIQSGLGGR